MKSIQVAFSLLVGLGLVSFVYPIETDPVVPESYKQHCVLCHGIDGEKALMGAPKFSKSILGIEDRIRIIAEGKNTMKAYKDVLSKEQIRVLALFTESIKDK